MPEKAATPLEALRYQLHSIMWNLQAWASGIIFGRRRSKQEATALSGMPIGGEDYRNWCVQVPRPGGIEGLRLVKLPDGACCIGYNVSASMVPRSKELGHCVTASSDASSWPSGFVVVKLSHFSVNYADVCIRWGLYESANKYVGWPIVPGFDIAGEVEWIAPDVKGLAIGDQVFGYTLFGGYASRVLVPSNQVRRIPAFLNQECAAAITSVAVTALHAAALGGHWPQQLPVRNRHVLIHSAGGGVGSLLCVFSRDFGRKITAVVGSAGKVDAVQKLGVSQSDIFVKSSDDLKKRYKHIQDDAGGFITIFDGNGGKSLAEGFQMLAPGGTLVSYGMHTILPSNAQSIGPLTWLRMLFRMQGSPKIDPHDLITSNRSVRGFNLSFLASEEECAEVYMDKILATVEAEQDLFKSGFPVKVYPIADLGKAHDFISSGKSVGKLVVGVQEIRKKLV